MFQTSPCIADVPVKQRKGPVLGVVSSHSIHSATGGPLLVLVVIDDHLNGVISLPAAHVMNVIINVGTCHP